MSSSHTTTAYKILTTAQWQSFRDSKSLTSSTTPLDTKDGYIHMSTAQQARETYEKYFKGQTDVVLVQVDLTKAVDIRWEVSRGGQEFPHCYDHVPLDATGKVWEAVTEKDMKSLEE